ncbi:MAG: von Willebrand factor type A domain-containing protein [Eubacteriales bacterium]
MKNTKSLQKLTALVLAALTLLAFVGCSAAANEDDMINNMPPSKGESYPGGIPTVPAGDQDAEYGEAGEIQQPGESPEQGDDEDVGQAPPVIAENPFISTAENNISTFSADVDTASYAFFRKMVNSGYTLSELRNSGSAFRTEEFINYFKYDVPQPKGGELFGAYTSVTPCPWNSETMLLRLTLQAEQAKPSKGNNLVFLIDVSGSMSSQDKLPLLKKAFSYLVGNLGENDIVSIVTYSGREAVVLEGCMGSKSETIMSAINSLSAKGSTNGEAGLTKAYQIAEEYYIEGGNNRIIMASDGDLNVGISSQSELTAYIEQKRDQGVYLSVLGFGSGNYKDSNMEALADNGNGVYYYIDGESEAEKVFGTDILGTLYTVAEDVKLQLEFNADAVEAYRLVGYENRLLDKEDFNDDTKDAGEVGASHQVTVCYEIKLAEQVPGAEVLATLRTRYKNPGEPLSHLNEYQIDRSDISSGEDADSKFLCAVIETCMILRKSQYLGDSTLDGIIEELESLNLSEYPERAEFLDLLRKLANKLYT